jgi:hypothetical protein
MSATPRRRRRAGSLGALKSRLWASIEYLVNVIDDETQLHEDRRASCNALTQSTLAYCRVMELYELEQGMQHLEHLATGNGHHA